MKQTLVEFLQESKLIPRWLILVAGLIGGFCGALLMLMFCLIGLL